MTPRRTLHSREPVGPHHEPVRRRRFSSPARTWCVVALGLAGEPGCARRAIDVEGAACRVVAHACGLRGALEQLQPDRRPQPRGRHRESRHPLAAGRKGRKGGRGLRGGHIQQAHQRLGLHQRQHLVRDPLSESQSARRRGELPHARLLAAPRLCGQHPRVVPVAQPAQPTACDCRTGSRT